MPKLVKPCTVLFDLDGTLVDSRKDIVTSFQATLGQLGYARPAFDAVTEMIGKPLDAMFQVLLSSTDKRLIEQASKIYREHYFQHCADESLPYPGVQEVLKTLHPQCNTAIATTKKTFMAVRVAELLGLAANLDHIQGTDGFACKPAPDVIHHALSALGVSTEHAVMVGDTTGDLLAARAAGIPCVAVSYGIGSRRDLQAAHPEVLIDTIEALPSCLHNMGLID